MNSIIKSTLTKSISLRTFSTSSTIQLSEGAPSGKSQDAFSKREKTEEERFIRQNEIEKMQTLRRNIEKNQKDLDKLEKEHHAQDNHAGDKKH